MEFLRIGETYERGFSERLYFFDDNLGGYTIEGIYRGLYGL